MNYMDYRSFGIKLKVQEVQMTITEKELLSPFMDPYSPWTDGIDDEDEIKNNIRNVFKCVNNTTCVSVKSIEKERLNSTLLMNVFDGNVISVKHALKSGADPNSRNKNNETCLHIAAWKGHYSAMKSLLKCNANKYSIIPDHPPLYCLRNPDVLTYAGHKNPKPFLRGKGARTPLNYVIRSTQISVDSKIQMIDLLLRYGYDLNDKRYADQVMPLEDACSTGSSQIVQHLLFKGASVIRAPNAIFKAVRSSKILSILMPYKPDVNISKKNKLISEKKNYDPHLMKGIPYHYTAKSGATPLHIAAANCDIIAISMLLDAGADIRLLDSADRTPWEILKCQIDYFYKHSLLTEESKMCFRKMKRLLFTPNVNEMDDPLSISDSFIESVLIDSTIRKEQ